MSYMRLFVSLVVCSVFVIGCVTREDGAFDDIDTAENAMVDDGFDTGDSASADESASSSEGESALSTEDEEEEYLKHVLEWCGDCPGDCGGIIYCPW